MVSFHNGCSGLSCLDLCCWWGPLLIYRRLDPYRMVGLVAIGKLGLHVYRLEFLITMPPYPYNWARGYFLETHGG